MRHLKRLGFVLLAITAPVWIFPALIALGVWKGARDMEERYDTWQHDRATGYAARRAAMEKRLRERREREVV